MSSRCITKRNELTHKVYSCSSLQQNTKRPGRPRFSGPHSRPNKPPNNPPDPPSNPDLVGLDASGLKPVPMNSLLAGSFGFDSLGLAAGFGSGAASSSISASTFESVKCHAMIKETLDKITFCRFCFDLFFGGLRFCCGFFGHRCGLFFCFFCCWSRNAAIRIDYW